MSCFPSLLAGDLGQADIAFSAGYIRPDGLREPVRLKDEDSMEFDDLASITSWTESISLLLFRPFS